MKSPVTPKAPRLCAGLLGLALNLPLHPALAADYVSVVADNTNLRSAPGATSEVVYKAPAGYPLKVVERRGDWIRTQDFEGDRAWIQSSLVNNEQTVIVKVRSARVRSAPDNSAPEVAKAAREVIFKKTGTQGPWVQVAHSRAAGWVYGSLLWP